MGWHTGFFWIKQITMLNTPYATTASPSCQEFTRQLCLHGDTYVTNAPFKVTSINMDGEELPAIWNTSNDPYISWVCSLLNSFGPAVRAELKLIPTSTVSRRLFNGLSHVAEFLLKRSGLGGGIFVENWFLPTTLYPQQRTAHSIIHAVTALEKQAIEQKLGHLPIFVRSLTPVLHEDIITKLQHHGFLLIPTRQIWLADNIQDGSWRQRSHNKRDLSLERKKAASTEWIEGKDFSDADFERSLFLYNQLYRGKYPEFNPEFTLSYLKTAVATGFMKFYGLRSVSQSNNETHHPNHPPSSNPAPLSGFVGIVRRDHIFTTPLFGYDRTQPTKEGLYRRLMLKVSLEAEQHQGIVHCSGGADQFKSLRGAQTHIEYAAVWINHLPLSQRAILQTLAKTINTLIAPFVTKKSF